MHGRWGDHEGWDDFCIISDPLEPAICEHCPQGTPPFAVFVLDMEGITTCLPCTFQADEHNRVDTVDPRRVHQLDGTVIDPWAVT